MALSPHSKQGDDLTEQLARSLHKAYMVMETAKGRTPTVNPSMVPWESLPEDLRRATMAQAADIGAKMAAIGAVVVPESAGAPAFTFTERETELLAQLEHERWWRAKLAESWVSGPSRRRAHKVHPDLVEWAELPDDVQEKDRDAIRALPAILHDAGFRILRLTST